MPSSQQPTTALPGARGQQQYPQAPPARPPVRQADVEQHTSVMPVRSTASSRPRPATPDRTNYVRTLAPLVGMSVVVVVIIAAITAWISSFQEPAGTPTLTADRPSATAPAPASPTAARAPATTRPRATTTRVVPKVVVPTTRAVPRTTAGSAPSTSRAAAGSGTTGSAANPTSASRNPSTRADQPRNGDNSTCTDFLDPACD